MKRLVAVIAVSIALLTSGRSGVNAGAPADLDALLAPIALYPDQLLAQMLLCAGNPGHVGALSEWLRSHETLKGTELQNAAVASGFTDSYAAIAIFPQVVDYMAGHMDWTTKLGAAFAADKSAVFDAIQRLRKKARDTGALKTTSQQKVETKTTTSGQQVVVIEPANPQVVYVPQYNPAVVYTQPTTVVVQQDNSAANAAVAGMIGFTAGIAIGAAFDNNYYYGPYGRGAYMYNDAWDDWYDNREDAREDWQDHREDMYDERSDRAKDAQDTRTDRQQNAQQQRTERSTQSTTQQRADRQAQPAATTAGASQEARGYSRDTSSAASKERSGTKSDAFSGYSSGKSERAASERGQKSRGSSRSSGGGSRRR